MTSRPVTTDGAVSGTPAPAEEQARLDRMVDAVRRLGAQLETTHRTLDEFVERLSDAARDARCAARAPAPAAPPSRAARAAVGTPVRRPDPVAAPATGSPLDPPAGLAEHLRAPGAAPEGPVTHGRRRRSGAVAGRLPDGSTG